MEFHFFCLLLFFFGGGGGGEGGGLVGCNSNNDRGVKRSLLLGDELQSSYVVEMKISKCACMLMNEFKVNLVMSKKRAGLFHNGAQVYRVHSATQQHRTEVR